MRILPVLLLLTAPLVADASKTSHQEEWLSSLDKALQAAEATDQLLLVDLFAEWCVWCKRLDDEVYSTKEFRDFAEDMTLLRVDTEDGAEGTELQQRYGVISLPTTLVLNSKLVKVGEIAGFAQAAAYVERIEQVIEAYRELEKGFEHYSRSTDPKVLTTLASEFHQRGDGERSAQIYLQMLSLDSLTSEEENWVRFQLSDSLRISKEFDLAAEHLANARRQAKASEEKELLERIDLLAGEIALDRGDCTQARIAFEAFLGKHPASDLRQYARQALLDLDSANTRCS